MDGKNPFHRSIHNVLAFTIDYTGKFTYHTICVQYSRQSQVDAAVLREIEVVIRVVIRLGRGRTLPDMAR
ncbi:hypothetical protein JCM18750_02420 [Halostagnicola bangensis]